MSQLSDDLLEHLIHYPQDGNPGLIQNFLRELKERRASALLGDAATTDLREAFYAGLAFIQDYLPGDIDEKLKQELWERWIKTKAVSS